MSELLDKDLLIAALQNQVGYLQCLLLVAIDKGGGRLNITRDELKNAKEGVIFLANERVELDTIIFQTINTLRLPLKNNIIQ